MTTQGDNKAHIRKCEPAIPDNTAPARSPGHTLASIRARARWESPGPCASERAFRQTAAARRPVILLSVPVTNALIPEEQRAGVHLRIGRLLLARMTADQLAEPLFNVENQLY
jgi:hypothetical protein